MEIIGEQSIQWNMRMMRQEIVEGKARNNHYRELASKTQTIVHQKATLHDGELKSGEYSWTYDVILPEDCPSSCHWMG